MPLTANSNNIPAYDTPEHHAQLTAWRKQTRNELLKARAALTPEDHQINNRLILDILSSSCFEEICTGIVAVYWPIRGEVDIRPFVDVIMDRGGLAAFPVVVAPKHPLEFRIWKPGDPMELGVYGIPYPSEGEAVEPDVLIVSLLGFDSECYRLGYGGGFYDRTLSAAVKKPITVGIGIDAGRLDTIRPQPYDIPMDYVVTESAFLSHKEITSHAAAEEVTAEVTAAE